MQLRRIFIHFEQILIFIDSTPQSILKFHLHILIITDSLLHFSFNFCCDLSQNKKLIGTNFCQFLSSEIRFYHYHLDYQLSLFTFEGVNYFKLEYRKVQFDTESKNSSNKIFIPPFFSSTLHSRKKFSKTNTFKFTRTHRSFNILGQKFLAFENDYKMEKSL